MDTREINDWLSEMNDVLDDEDMECLDEVLQALVEEGAIGFYFDEELGEDIYYSKESLH